MASNEVTHVRSLESELGELLEHAAASHVPQALAAEARAATARALGDRLAPDLSEGERARVRAYFWSVVRRRALRSAEAAAFTAGMVRASIANDLREAGLGEERIVRELAHCAV